MPDDAVAVAPPPGRARARPAGRITARRVPFMAIAILSMACGAWIGLVRIGWPLPLAGASGVAAHGPFMVCGFLGTLIGVERAIALGSRWAYAAPAFVAAGALALDLPAGSLGPLLITAGSLVLVAVFVVLVQRQPALYMMTMASGAVAWTIGNAFWIGGAPLVRVVYWWVAFLVLTIAGERLELNRVLRPPLAVRATFAAAATTVLAGVVISTALPRVGIRTLGAGLLAFAVWLLVHDVARRTVRQHGLTRYMAVLLLAGYAWLGFGGLVLLVTGVTIPGLVYDAALHAVFLGFVMSMVFAHAPVVFPAVLGRALPFHPRFYLHAAVLHVSVVVRILGDLAGGFASWRPWGGLLNVVALAVFVANMAAAVVRARR